MLQLNHVTKCYSVGKGDIKYAVNDVSFSIGEHKIVAIIGESGSGKSTIAELVIGLQEPSLGAIEWDHTHDGGTCKNKMFSKAIVFQNPDRSLNPYWTIQRIIAEPLYLKKQKKSQIQVRVNELLQLVGLDESFLNRYPKECSGGQKQRVAIARALALSPQLLIADEITSALDPFTEMEIMNLLKTLTMKQQMSLLYITHRLESLAHFADEVIVLKDGKIVEQGACNVVLNKPQHEYTIRLLNATTY